MGVDPLKLFGWFMILAGVVMGIAALIALLRRTRLSRILGVISIACVAIAFLALVVSTGRLPDHYEALPFAFFPIPGIVGIVFNRPKRIPPGHCKQCGYNLTGNVSGVCSECGLPATAAHGKSGR